MRLPRLLALALLASLAADPVQGAAGEWQVNGPSRLRLISDSAVASPDGELRLGIHFRLEPGWHVYWKNSGDAGFPPTVTFPAAPGLRAADLLWPAPERYELAGGLLAFGYENEMVYPVRARLEAAPGGLLRLAADVDYLVCEVDCIPFRSVVTLEQPLGAPREDTTTARLLEPWFARVPQAASAVAGVTARTEVSRPSPAAGQPASDSAPAGPPVLEIVIEGAEPTPRSDLFLEVHDVFEAGRPERRDLPGGVAFRVPLSLKSAGKPLPASSSFAWTATGLSRGGRPLALEARATVPMAAPPASRPAGPAGVPAATGLPATLALALIAGLASCLSPGALALILGEGLALRAALPAGRPAVARRALAAAAGLLLAAWGLAAAPLARNGDLAWGAHLERPGVATPLAVAATLLALNLWGFLEAPLAATRTGADAAPQGAAPRSPNPLWRHALAGAFAPLLAMAWPVPWLTAPLGFAARQGAAAALAVVTAAALGLALPWLAAAAAPRLATVLPAPGPRARNLREALGFAAGATTLWLLYRLARLLAPESLAAVELSLLALALVAWLRRHSSGKAKLSGALALVLAACALAAVWLADPSN